MNRDILILLLLVVVVVILLRNSAADSSGMRVRSGAYGTQIDYGSETGGGRCG